MLFIITCPALVYAWQPAVVSANSEASRIGLKVLEKGGSAADAAIATAFALAVAEPYNSGLGGGGFLLYYVAKENRFYFVDYREAAPQKIPPGFFQKNPEKLRDGITSVAVPGFVKGMETIHQKWRQVSWPSLIDPSIELAKKGVRLMGAMREKIVEAKDRLKNDPVLNEIFVQPQENASFKIVQNDLAATLENIKTGGADVFYKGEIAQKIADAMKQNGGLITTADLASYNVTFRKPVSFQYDKYTLTSSPLPSSGGKGLELLFRRAIVNRLGTLMSTSPRMAQLLVDSFKRYFDFRDIAMGDTASNVAGQTTHLNVIDKEGNIAAMTNALNAPFGSGVAVPGTGIILNNEMADFSGNPASPNRVRGGLRPLSSMAPTIIFKGDKPLMAIGTPGGTTIPQNLFQILFSHWSWKNLLSRAIAAPRIYYDPGTREVVAEEKVSTSIIETLEQDNTVVSKPAIGNVQALVITGPSRTETYSDPRGEGEGMRLH